MTQQSFHLPDLNLTCKSCTYWKISSWTISMNSQIKPSSQTPVLAGTGPNSEIVSPHSLSSCSLHHWALSDTLLYLQRRQETCEKYPHFLNQLVKRPTVERCCFIMWRVCSSSAPNTAVETGNLLNRFQVCMRNQSGLLAMLGSRSAYTGKPQTAHKKMKDESDMEALVLTSTPGREIIAGPFASFPRAMKRSSMLANHRVSLYFGRRTHFQVCALLHT